MSISILRITVRQAYRNYAEQITSEIIERAMPKVHAERYQKDLDTLTPHQQTPYEIIKDHEEISPTELWKEYKKRMEYPKTDRTVPNYLSKMVQYNISKTEGTSRDWAYRPVSETFDRIERE